MQSYKKKKKPANRVVPSLEASVCVTAARLLPFPSDRPYQLFQFPMILTNSVGINSSMFTVYVLVVFLLSSICFLCWCLFINPSAPTLCPYFMLSLTQ